MGQYTSNLPAGRSSLYDELPHKGAVEVSILLRLSTLPPVAHSLALNNKAHAQK